MKDWPEVFDIRAFGGRFKGKRFVRKFCSLDIVIVV